MQGKKINMLVLIVMILIALVIGGIIGFFVPRFLEINNEVCEISQVKKENSEIEEVREENVEEIKEEGITTENKQNVTMIESPKYDGNKSISINGKAYTVSYSSEKFEWIANPEHEQTEVKLYLNDKKVKTLNLGYLNDINHEYGDKDYGVELYTFSQEYILVMVKTKYNDGEYEAVNKLQFCIINTNGECISTLEWTDATQIAEVQTGKDLKYEINDNSIILYELSCSGALKYEYTVLRDVMNKKLLEIYDENEIIQAGK